MMTLPSKTRGAPVMLPAFFGSTVSTLQTGRPDFASMAMRRPSTVPT